MRISRSVARRLALACQGLDGHWRAPPGKEGISMLIERLGYVQIDTISVVRRAHHHTLWARSVGYEPSMLRELQAADRRVFEWWAPAMSYVPMSDYRYYAVHMGPGNIRPWQREWFMENKEIIDHVLERIRAEGPLGSSDFQAPEGFRRGAWWSRKPAKQALEALFDMGVLMVTERQSFQRVYDLRERVLPAWVDTTTPREDDLGHFVVRRALGSMGFAPTSDVRWGTWRGVSASDDAVRELADSGQVATFEIDGLGGQTFCALTDVLDAVIREGDDEATVHILSPFDNLVIHRRWLRTFFDFDYKLEAYTPAAKRKYGYFSLPVLWGEQFVGRMDAKADRQIGAFAVRNLVFEPGCADYESLFLPLAQKLRSLAAFAGCERIVVEKTAPGQAREPLQRALDQGC
jgi:uncharacterized protein YcaQ